MFQIGLFSKMNRITTKTLRHYDEIGLLKPAYVDDFTGYRYYSSEQLPRLHTIIGLKQLGLSLDQIKSLLIESAGLDVFIDLKQKELNELINSAQQQLKLLESYQKKVRGEYMMDYTPIIKSLPEVIVASMTFIAPSYDTYFDIIPKMGDEMRRQGAKCASPAYCFNIYHDGEYKEKDIHVEVCEAVVDYCEDSDMVQYKKVGKVEKAVCVLHKGPYVGLREAYGFIFSWIEDNGYEVIGLPRESYIDGIWNKESEEEWLTEIQIPVATK